MSDTITIGGVTLTTEEAGEVLAWVDKPTLPVPDRVTIRSLTNGRYGIFIIGDGLPGRLAVARLTGALIEQLRDHCFPWREVRRDEVQPGERVRVEGDPVGRIYDGVMTDERVDNACSTDVAAPAGSRIVVKDDGVTEHVPHYATVFVRRPREVGTRLLGDVRSGSTVESDDGSRVVVYEGGPDCATRWVADVEPPHVVGAWSRDTLVRIVEGES